MIVDRVLSLTTARSVEEAWAHLVVFLDGHGFDRLIYGSTRLLSGSNIGPHDDLTILFHHDEAYLRAFLDREMYANAPMMRWAFDHVGAQSWGWIARNSESLTAEEQRVLEFNRSMDVRAGYTISFPPLGPRERAVLGLTARRGISQTEIDAYWAEHGREISALCDVFHLKAMTMPATTRGRELTDRQRQVLEWVGDGKTVQDIALLIDRRPATVEKHLRLAREALGVETTAQAVLKAAFLGKLFRVPPGT